MKRRISAGLIVVGAALVAVAMFWLNQQSAEIDASFEASPKPEAVLAAIRQAEVIRDPLERCLAYPDPVGSQWPKEAVAAFCADLFTPTLAWREFKNYIEDGAIDELEARLAALQDGYYAGRIPEGAWMQMYSSNFYGYSAESREFVDSWLEQVPGSAHALFARALQEYSVVASARGEGPLDEVDLAARERMRVAAESSMQYLDRALAADKRLTPAYRVQIWIAKIQGNQQLAAQAMAQAIAVDPANFYVRSALMETYEPRWGGSFVQMDRLAEESMKFMAKNPRLSNLRAIALAHRGLFLHFDESYQSELQAYKKGLAFGPVGFYFDLASYAASEIGDPLLAVELSSQMLRFGPYNTRALGRRIRELKKLGEDDWALSDIERLLQIDPNNTDALASYANSMIKAEKFVAAETRLKQLIAADPSNSWAKKQLSWLYGNRMNRIDEADALIGELLVDAPEDGDLWLQRIRLLESRPGPEMRAAIESFLKYADESSPEQKNAIAGAHKWLTNHPTH